ncbi:MAG: carboxymuconolactone decarboxylase family protein [Pseudomonadota bacterium]
MNDLHEILTEFKKDFPQVYADYEKLGKEIHLNSGPLSENTRWLLKVAISAASHRLIALETHIIKAKNAGVTDEELKHALLMLIPTTGFPAFMEAYTVLKKI